MSIFLGLIIISITVFLLFWYIKTTRNLNQQFNLFIQEVSERLKEINLYLESTQRSVGERLDSATRVFGDLKLSLGKLEESYHQIYMMAKEISSLQDLLSAPKFRGDLGEILLEKLLEDIIPKEFVRFQYRFQNSEKVDAVIIIGNNLIPIDAKFSWDNFKKFTEADTEDKRDTFYRIFVRDIKNRIDEISTKYIRPDENTFDFAFMYIPAEAIYYHISKDSELTSYARNKKVIFVSPNTFYAYLEAILLGLRSINIHKNIKKIFLGISQLRHELGKFQEDFNLMGLHLSNATKKYNDSRIQLELFSQKLTSTIDAQIEYEQGGSKNEQSNL